MAAGWIAILVLGVDAIEHPTQWTCDLWTTPMLVLPMFLPPYGVELRADGAPPGLRFQAIAFAADDLGVRVSNALEF